VKVLYGIHERETQKKKPLKRSPGLNYIDVKSAAGEVGK
jgi:hypothetical protein